MADPTLFICYSHTDRRYREQFSKFLEGPQLKGITIFSDATIQPGDDWRSVIIENLQKATAALILVSQDFLISPFIQEVELRNLMSSYIQRGLRLFLVPVRSMLYEGTYLEQFQWARPPNRPLSLLTEPEQEAAMVEICRTIVRLANDGTDAPSAEHTIKCLEKMPKLDLPSVYELQEPIGEGEFARCFLAQDRLLGRPVVIKVLHTPLSRDSPAYDKYVRSASKLTHRNILGLLYSQANKLPHFIVTLSVGDDTLETRLQQRGRLPIDEAVQTTMRIADTLAYAHRQGCVHGRLHTCEVRFDGEGEHILSGFRTAQSCAGASAVDAAERRISLEAFVASSPEQRAGVVVDAKSDQYQLGLLAYEMIAGAPPVRAADVTWASILDPQTARNLVHPQPLHEFVDGCGPRISEVVMRMLSVDPADRWDSLERVRRELQSALSSRSPHESAKASYRRCAQDDRFYETLYTSLFETMPGIGAMFAGRSMAQQYQVLRDALWLLLSYAESQESGEPTILSGVARTHGHFDPMQFDLFRDAVLTAVGTHDPLGPAAVAAWREAIGPGMDYLKSRVAKGDYIAS